LRQILQIRVTWLSGFQCRVYTDINFNIFNSADNDFFYSVKTNSTHVLQPYLPDQTNILYRLRTRPHNMTMINKTKFLNDTDFIMRMWYKYSY